MLQQFGGFNAESDRKVLGEMVLIPVPLLDKTTHHRLEVGNGAAIVVSRGHFRNGAGCALNKVSSYPPVNSRAQGTFGWLRICIVSRISQKAAGLWEAK